MGATLANQRIELAQKRRQKIRRNFPS
jgi:hypothetical protein